MNPAPVSANRRQIVLSLLASIAFAVLCIWMLTFLTDKNRLLFLFTAFIALPLFSYSTVMSLKLLISKEPLLTINQKGITDDASGLAVGFIPWSDILGANITTIKKRKFLHIHLRNPLAYVKKASFPRRLLMRINVLFGGSTISISDLIMSESLEDILENINTFKQQEEKKYKIEPNDFQENV
jgi:hypothetical protein